MYERILVPLDGSEGAEVVLPLAEEIAARAGGEMVFVSVFHPAAPNVGHMVRSYLEHLVERVEHRLTQVGRGQQTKVRSEVLAGRPADEILRYADENSASLIVIASRTSLGRRSWALGNVAGKVIRATSKAVLVVKAQGAGSQRGRPIRKILVPLDGSRVGESAIPSTEPLVRLLGAEVVLFHVVRPAMPPVGLEGSMSYPLPQGEEESRKATALEYLGRAARLFQEKGLNVSGAVSVGSPADEILDYAKANAVDLIAMSSHGRSGIGRWVFGSVTAKVLQAGNTDVLVIRAVKA